MCQEPMPFTREELIIFKQVLGLLRLAFADSHSTRWTGLSQSNSAAFVARLMSLTKNVINRQESQVATTTIFFSGGW